MLNLAYALDNEVQIGEDTYSINMAYDNILLFIELLGDKSVPADEKLKIGIEILIGEQLEYPIETLEKIFAELLKIVFETEEQEPEEVTLDLAGNPLPDSFQKKEKVHYNLIEDAQYIFSSFKHYYGIDLFEVQGELDWRKFKAYLSDLGSDTKFKEVLEIRTMKIPKDATQEERENINQLKEAYRLSSDNSDIENGAMDLAERQALIKKQMAEAKGKEVE